MPEKPAIMEHKAPVRKAMDVFHSRRDNPKRINIVIKKITRIKYSLLRNAMAPS
jgi:hypothetical protein